MIAARSENESNAASAKHANWNSKEIIDDMATSQVKKNLFGLSGHLYYPTHPQH
jgi:hypothetical protein